ncbi:flagellar basal-body rod protein FlgF [Parendozoicomonas haliclonae]|uniref:Flagellar basal-body rod protein FlgF n=1 Tax=Parendozoicomonas haliclonae TaxID=1960125 RepID=A0A1X7AMY2_9GAMM|nr:flagellar basal-body rod protein FlgF [Parendozoicomonas haliclonae]SMA49654.1 Flagellar basal-body rod protein FlgF [Parendozoicomonas haliclonae]
MDKAIYTAMSGASRTMFQQRLHANNLANVNTHGFRADFAEILAKNVDGQGLPTRVLTETVGTWSSEKAGNMTSTGRNLDVAIAGEGWLAVEDATGNESYTRGGQLHVTMDGQLVTGRGEPVLDQGGAAIVIPEYEQLHIGPDGTISVLGSGDPKSQPVTIGQLKLVKSETPLNKGTDGLFRADNNEPLNADLTVKVVSGALESSNVNAMEEMVTFMSLGRQFEMQLKTIETARQMAESGDRLIRGS